MTKNERPLKNKPTKEPRKGRPKKKRSKKSKSTLHRHYLYSAAVQSVDADLAFFRRIYKKRNGETFRRLREDFCGTAVLACDWVRRDLRNEAWGIDLDQPTLDWGVKHYGPRLGKSSKRLHLQCRDVLQVTRPKVDLVAALNFSYSVFHTRDMLSRYFRQVCKSLAHGGVFVLDAWGGSETMCEDLENRSVEAEEAFDGKKIPSFTYVWEQSRFNPIDHRIVCHIHFKLRDGTRMKKAFTYDWRLWTLPEMRELLLDAGFVSADVYVEGWDDEEDESDGIFRKRKYFENQEGWVAYVVAHA